jgi:hypothetical protein
LLIFTFFPTYPFALSHAWWESTKWINWKEFARTGQEKFCDKVKMNKLE